jgi:hypothetical protein
MEAQTGIQRAVEMMGSPAKLAEAVGNGVLRQHVEHWLDAGRVSPPHAPRVSTVTGVPLGDLNPQVPWATVPEALRRAKRATTVKAA